MQKFKYFVERELNEETIKDILTTAIEGGISYWAILCNDEQDWIDARNKWKAEHNDAPCYCDVAFELLSNDKYVVFEEEETGERSKLTMAKLLKGCRMFEEVTGLSINGCMDDGSFDANDADVIIQNALFDEVVYG